MNNLGKLNDELFAELDRLAAAEGDGIAAEAARAKEVVGLSSKIIENARLSMDAVKLKAHLELEVGQAVHVPRMLGDGE